MRQLLLILTIMIYSTLQKVSSSEPTVLFIFPESCFEKLKSFEIDTACLTKILSNSLSFGILTFSFIYKVPQILKIDKQKSAAGMPWNSVAMDMMSIMSTIGYYYLH